jgi:peroxiredoxin
MEKKIGAGAAMPEFSLPRAGGGVVEIGGKGRWQLLVVYRGKHCPICKRYLLELEALTQEFAGIDTEIVAISADPKEKAEPHVADMKLTFPVGYGLQVGQMRELGLYVSAPRSEAETDRPFAEPGVYVVNSDGNVQIVDISNAPFARPDLAAIAKGIAFVKNNGYPPRGTLV